MTANRPVGVERNRWPVTAQQGAEVLVRRPQLQYREKARPDEFPDRASLSSAALRRVTLRRWAYRAATPSAGQALPAGPGPRGRPPPAPNSAPRNPPTKDTRTVPPSALPATL